MPEVSSIPLLQQYLPDKKETQKVKEPGSGAADRGIHYLENGTVDNRVDACECGHMWLPQLFVMRWQPDKLWLRWLHQLPGPTSHSVFPDWLFLSDATHDGKSLVSFGEDYIIILVKMLSLFYLYFHSRKCSHTGAYLGTGLQPCQSISLIIRSLQVPAEMCLDAARMLLVFCESFSMIRFCL